MPAIPEPRPTVYIDPRASEMRIGYRDLLALLEYQRRYPEEYAGLPTTEELLRDLPPTSRAVCDTMIQVQQFDRLFGSSRGNSRFLRILNGHEMS